MPQLLKKFLALLDHRYIGILACGLILLGLVSFRALMSIGMMTLGVRAVFSLAPRKNIQYLLENKALLALLGIFALYVLSGFWSDNLHYWGDRVRMKLPFLALPFGFAALHNLKWKDYQYLLYAFFWLISLICLVILGIYLNNFEQLNEVYKAGHVLPTPIHHIRFSLMMVYAFALGLYFWETSFSVRFPKYERIAVAFLTLFLFLFVHVLAVRSGLLALYCVSLYQFVRYIIRSKKYFIAIGGGILLIVAIGISFYTVPTLSNKVGYTIYNVKHFLKNNKLERLSDSKRIATIEAAIVEGREHWLLGIGIGDVQDATTNYLQKHYPNIADLGVVPHNQYLFVWMGMGTIGLLLFMFLLLYPLFYLQSYRNSHFVSLYFILLSSCLVEHTLETQIGTAFFTLFIFIGINMISMERQNGILNSGVE